VRSRSFRALVWQRFAADRWSLAGLFFVGALAALALFAPLLAGDRPILTVGGWSLMPPVPYSPTAIDLPARLAPPDGKHYLGTDDRGRDVAARMIHGSRVSLAVGLVAVSLVVLIGTALGALAGYYGGWVDALISRATEVMMCFPTFFLILALLAFLPPSIFNIMAVIGLTGWPGTTRLVRAEFLRLRNLDYVTAARAIGASDARIIFSHVLPNALGPVLVTATFGVAGAVLVESALSYLGFGVPPPTPSWGDILSLSKAYIDFAWWLTVFPGAAIFLTVTSFNLVGEGLRDAVDPRLK
jgi:peptide/nickel transport system permease protein